MPEYVAPSRTRSTSWGKRARRRLRGPLSRPAADTRQDFRRLPPLNLGEEPPTDERQEDPLTRDDPNGDGDRVLGPRHVVQPPAEPPRLAQPDVEPSPGADDHPPRAENDSENPPEMGTAGDRQVYLSPPPAWDPC